MKVSKESRVLLGLVLGSIVLLCVPFAWTTKLICGPLSLAAVFLAGRQQSRLRPEASMDERDFLLVAQAFGLLTLLAWALFLCYVWPGCPSTTAAPQVRTPEARRPATPPLLLALSRKIGPPIPGDRDYWFPINQDEALVIKGRKGEPCVLLRHNLLTGAEVPLKAASESYVWWNHNHTTISPDGRWLLWRAPSERIKAASLITGDHAILAWHDDADEHEDMQFLPDSRHWMLVDRHAHQIEIYDIQEPNSRRVLPVSSDFPDASAVNGNGSIVDVDETLPATFGHYRHDIDSLITDGATEAIVTSATSSPTPRVTSTATVAFPGGTRFDSYRVTKAGDRIAWLCIRPGTTYDGDGQIASVWVTDGRGRNWREAGQLPAREKGDAFYVSGLHLDWTDDGKRLRFEWRDGIREVSFDPTTATTSHSVDGIPDLARIAGLTVGDSTFEEVEGRIGKGFAYLGGHPLGSREWRLTGSAGYLSGDGMYYYSSGRGRVVGNFEITSEPENPDEKLPEVRHPLALDYEGVINLGMSRSDCLAALSSKFGNPSKSTTAFLEWRAAGYHRINTVRDEDEHEWVATLTFRNGRLISIAVCAG